MHNILPYLENGVSIFFQRRHLRKISYIRLKNEINFNLRIMDMINWKNISKDTKKYLSKQLTTRALEEYIYLGKETSIEKLLSVNSLNPADKTPEESPISKESLAGNIINKIKTLKVIIDLPQDLAVVDDKSNFTARLKNISLGLNDLKKLI